MLGPDLYPVLNLYLQAYSACCFILLLSFYASLNRVSLSTSLNSDCEVVCSAGN